MGNRGMAISCKRAHESNEDGNGLNRDSRA
jgi:hypothetical protein